MDIVAHAAYGATFCSRAGLSGGRRGFPGKYWYQDSTVWWSAFFGILPDVISMWIPFVVFRFSGVSDNFFHHFDGTWLIVYRCIHNLITASILSALVFYVRRSLFVPSLAFGLHVLCDMISHSEGRWQTMPFYPLTEWGIKGIAFWQNLWFVLAYWAVLFAIWIFLIAWRGRRTVRGELIQKMNKS